MLVSVSILAVAAVFSIFLRLKNNLLAPLETFARSRDMTKKGYETIVSEISDSFHRMESDRDQLVQQREFLIPLAIGKALNRMDATSSEELRQACAETCLQMAKVPEDSLFAVFAIVRVEDNENFFSRTVPADFGRISSMHYFLENALNDLLFSEYPGVLAPLDQNSIVVIVPCEAEDTLPIKSVSDKLITFFEKNYSVLLAATELHTGSGYAAFMAAMDRISEEVSFISFWGSGDSSERMEEQDSSFLASCNGVRSLILGLTAANYPETWAAFDQIISQAIPASGGSADLSRYRIYAMSSFIITAVEEKLGIALPLAQLKKLVSRLYEATNIAHYRREIQNVLQEVVRYQEELDRTRVASGRMEDIRQYLNAHFADSGLNVATVAEKFEISVSYLSRSFKNIYHVNLLEYIQRLRVKASKPLLARDTVLNVAQAVGFWDSQGLIRAFKKYEGMSPGDYKRLLEKNSQSNS